MITLQVFAHAHQVIWKEKTEGNVSSVEYDTVRLLISWQGFCQMRGEWGDPSQNSEEKKHTSVFLYILFQKQLSFYSTSTLLGPVMLGLVGGPYSPVRLTHTEKSDHPNKRKYMYLFDDFG
jgi:hypothetical protein